MYVDTACILSLMMSGNCKCVLKKTVLQKHYRQNYYSHTFAARKICLQLSSCNCYNKLKTPLLLFLLLEYNFVLVTTVLVYVVKVHTNHVQCMYMSTKYHWCLLLLTWHNVHGLFSLLSWTVLLYFVELKHLSLSLHILLIMLFMWDNSNTVSYFMKQCFS